MGVVYLEDLVEKIGNKYLAVNIAAQRARQINEKSIRQLNSNPKKAVAVALEELLEDQLEYHKVDLLPSESDDLFLFSEPDESEEQYHHEQYLPDTTNTIDDEEPEEGL